MCTGLPNPQSTLIASPEPVRDRARLGPGLRLVLARASWSLSVLMVRLWRDRGVARRLMAVRDNETGAGAMGIPLARTKLLAFALSGFIAGYAGVCLAFATERFSTATFDPTFSILVVSMVVIGGLGSIDGAVLGAIYLVGHPGHLRHHPDHPVPDQRARPAGLHPLPARGAGRAAPPARRPGDRGRRAAAVEPGPAAVR